MYKLVAKIQLFTIRRGIKVEFLFILSTYSIFYSFSSTKNINFATWNKLTQYI